MTFEAWCDFWGDRWKNRDREGLRMYRKERSAGFVKGNVEIRASRTVVEQEADRLLTGSAQRRPRIHKRKSDFMHRYHGPLQ